MRKHSKAREALVDAVVGARDGALAEIGRRAERRQHQRATKARRRSAKQVVLAAATAGAALAAGALVVRRGRRAKAESIPLSGKGEVTE